MNKTFPGAPEGATEHPTAQKRNLATPKCCPSVSDSWKNNKNQWFFIDFQHGQSFASGAKMLSRDPSGLSKMTPGAHKDPHGPPRTSCGPPQRYPG